MGAIKSSVCAKGHPFDRVSADGKRQRCIRCERARLIAWRAKKKQNKFSTGNPQK